MDPGALQSLGQTEKAYPPADLWHWAMADGPVTRP